MSIRAAIPLLQDNALYQFLRGILLRAVDGTVVPLLVDYTNFTVTVKASGTAVFQVQDTSGNVVFSVDTNNGLVKLRAADGTQVKVKAVSNGLGGYTLDVFT